MGRPLDQMLVWQMVEKMVVMMVELRVQGLVGRWGGWKAGH